MRISGGPQFKNTKNDQVGFVTCKHLTGMRIIKDKSFLRSLYKNIHICFSMLNKHKYTIYSLLKMRNRIDITNDATSQNNINAFAITIQGQFQLRNI